MPARFNLDKKYRSDTNHEVKQELSIRSGAAVRGDELGIQFIVGTPGEPWHVFTATPEQALVAAAKIVHSTLATQLRTPIGVGGLRQRSATYLEMVRMFKAGLDALVEADGRVSM